MYAPRFRLHALGGEAMIDPDITSRPYRPTAACETCCFGRGPHAEWCVASPSPTPLDDIVDPNSECDCEFTPYHDEDGPSVHYYRRCYVCGECWYSLHCPHEGPRQCGNHRAGTPRPA